MDVSAKASKAETALRKARADRRRTVAERLRGAKAAVRDVDSAIRSYIADHYDALAAELAEGALADKARVDAALAEVPAALRAREETSQRFAALLTAVGRVRPGTLPWSRSAVSEMGDTGLELQPGGAVRRDPAWQRG